jgi:hypothetical protein
LVVSLFWFGPCLQPVAPVDTLAPPPTLSPPYVLPPSPSGHMCVSFRCLAGWPGRRPITYAPLHQPPESGGYSISSGPPHHASQFDVGAPPRKREMRWPLLCDVRGAPAAAEAADSRQAHAPSAATSDAFLLCTPVWSRTVFLDILSTSCTRRWKAIRGACIGVRAPATVSPVADRDPGFLFCCHGSSYL